MKPLSRRSALFSAAVIPALAVSGSVPTIEADIVLLQLGREFDAVAAELDHAIEHGLDTNWKTLEELTRLDAQILAMPAATMEGLCVKARLACWALLGDLDAGAQHTADERAALSMVRDLIRLYCPHLERPGALRKLVEDIEQNASRSS